MVEIFEFYEHYSINSLISNNKIVKLVLLQVRFTTNVTGSE